MKFMSLKNNVSKKMTHKKGGRSGKRYQQPFVVKFTTCFKFFVIFVLKSHKKLNLYSRVLWLLVTVAAVTVVLAFGFFFPKK